MQQFTSESYIMSNNSNGFPVLSCKTELKLTPWSRVRLEKLIVTHLIKKFPIFYGTSKFITVFTNLPLVTVLSHMNPGHNFPLCFSKILSIIIFQLIPRFSKWSFAISFLTKI